MKWVDSLVKEEEGKIGLKLRPSLSETKEVYVNMTHAHPRYCVLVPLSETFKQGHHVLVTLETLFRLIFRGRSNLHTRTWTQYFTTYAKKQLLLAQWVSQGSELVLTRKERFKHTITFRVLAFVFYKLFFMCTIIGKLDCPQPTCFAH